jgi:hypothetical protein
MSDSRDEVSGGRVVFFKKNMLTEFLSVKNPRFLRKQFDEIGHSNGDLRVLAKVLTLKIIGHRRGTAVFLN